MTKRTDTLEPYEVQILLKAIDTMYEDNGCGVPDARLLPDAPTIALGGTLTKIRGFIIATFGDPDQ